MKTIYTWLVAGMLAMATATPVLSIPVPTSALEEQFTEIEMTDALVRRILEEASGDLEAQLALSLSPDFLFHEYKQGRVAIDHLGCANSMCSFTVTYSDGIGTVLVEDIW